MLSFVSIRIHIRGRKHCRVWATAFLSRCWCKWSHSTLSFNLQCNRPRHEKLRSPANCKCVWAGNCRRIAICPEIALSSVPIILLPTWLPPVSNQPCHPPPFSCPVTWPELTWHWPDCSSKSFIFACVLLTTRLSWCSYLALCSSKCQLSYDEWNPSSPALLICHRTEQPCCHVTWPGLTWPDTWRACLSKPPGVRATNRHLDPNRQSHVAAGGSPSPIWITTTRSKLSPLRHGRPSNNFFIIDQHPIKASRCGIINWPVCIYMRRTYLSSSLSLPVHPI